MALKEGDRAPDFELKGDSGELVRLSDELKDKDFVVLAFFPAAFSSVCTTELNIFQETLGEFEHMGAGLMGVSTDNFYSLKAFKEKNNLTFPLLADFQPRGAVAAQFGVMEEDGMTGRALFVVDADRTVRFAQVVERKVNPGVDKVLAKLEHLTQEGEQWKATGTS